MAHATKHYHDPLKLYETFGRKPLWLRAKDVAAHQESQVVLDVK